MSTPNVPVKNMKFAVTPLVLTPFVPFRWTLRGMARRAGLWAPEKRADTP